MNQSKIAYNFFNSFPILLKFRLIIFEITSDSLKKSKTTFQLHSNLYSSMKNKDTISLLIYRPKFITPSESSSSQTLHRQKRPIICMPSAAVNHDNCGSFQRDNVLKDTIAFPPKKPAPKVNYRLHSRGFSVGRVGVVIRPGMFRFMRPIPEIIASYLERTLKSLPS